MESMESRDAWVDAHLDAVYGTALGVLLDRAAAEDATVDCFRHACRTATLGEPWPGRRQLVAVVLERCRATAGPVPGPRARRRVDERVAVAAVVGGGLSVDQASQTSGLPASVVTALVGACRGPLVSRE
jgi:hypothetical protein